MTSSTDNDEMISDINLTPLVDVSLVLVIIFMVVAPFLTQILKPLKLPEATRAGLSEQNTIKVSLFSDGTLAVGASTIKPVELIERVKQEVANGKPPWVMVRAGAEVSHGEVMKVLRSVKAAGAQRVAFAVTTKEEKR